MSDENGYNDDAPLDVAAIHQNGHVASQPHPQADALGIAVGGPMGSTFDKLIEGSENFTEWAPRGKRTPRVSVAEVHIMSEAQALTNPNFPLTSLFMKGVRAQRGFLTLMAVPKPKMDKYEFWLVIAGMATILGVLFLITTMVAE